MWKQHHGLSPRFLSMSMSFRLPLFRKVANPRQRWTWGYIHSTSSFSFQQRYVISGKVCTARAWCRPSAFSTRFYCKSLKDSHLSMTCNSGRDQRQNEIKVQERNWERDMSISLNAAVVADKVVPCSSQPELFTFLDADTEVRQEPEPIAVCR